MARGVEDAEDAEDAEEGEEGEEGEDTEEGEDAGAGRAMDARERWSTDDVLMFDRA